VGAATCERHLEGQVSRGLDRSGRPGSGKATENTFLQCYPSQLPEKAVRESKQCLETGTKSGNPTRRAAGAQMKRDNLFPLSHMTETSSEHSAVLSVRLGELGTSNEDVD
jgi:hypothetical protein